MPHLFHFTNQSIPIQSNELKSYGVKSDNLFRITSSFDIVVDISAYAMFKGTILLQQQATNPDKVNLILKPFDLSELKLPVKYVIYRGLKIQDFLDNNNITDTNNKVKTSGTELLSAIQIVQKNRAPGDDVPVQALFGNELTPASDKNIDEFFFKNLALKSQLFTVEGGLELGKFAIGEIGIEIILENPEYFIKVETAKKDKFEIDVTGVTNPADKKWQKDLVRHFIDPAAFYGTHHDIPGGIEYREGANKLFANAPQLVYEKIVAPFATKNKIYLDIRNENGYSYNYYNNYVGTGVDADKELKIAQDPATLVLKEYYTQGWAIHILDVITPSSTASENKFYISLRINDNERPLLASWNTEPTTYQVADPPIANPSNSRVFFTDETMLLDTPIPATLPEFTKNIGFKVPNISALSKQLATIVKLDYIKQFREADAGDSFPHTNPIDYLFGPINTKIPWDSEDGVQWIGSNHHKYFDGWLNQAYFNIQHVFLVNSFNINTNEIVLTGNVEEMIPLNMINKIFVNNTISLVISSKRQDGTNTTIVVSGIIDSTNPSGINNLGSIGLTNGSSIYCFNTFKAIIDYPNNSLLIENFDLSQFNNYLVANPNLPNNAVTIDLHYKLNSTPIIYQLHSIILNQTTTAIRIHTSTPLTKKGIGCIMNSGIVSETNVSTEQGIDNDNVLFYAFPEYYFKKTGSIDTNFFNYHGGIAKEETLIDYIKKRNPQINIVKSSIQTSVGNYNYLLSFNTSVYINNENFLLLAICKNEFQNLIAQTQPSTTPVSSDFSDYHIKMLKLVAPAIPSPRIDVDGEIFQTYKLVVAGLDRNGNYKQTIVNQGIDVYSKDGQLFSSSEYSQNLQTVAGANYIVQFTRPSSYKKHYGFDWLRDEYIAATDPIINREGICISHDLSITKKEAQDQLKQEYTPININGNIYYTPWLSMYENHGNVIANAQGVAYSSPDHDVILSLKIKPINGYSGFQPTDIIRLEVPDGIQVSVYTNNIAQNPANQLLASQANNPNTILTIRCNKKSNLNRKIIAYDQNNNIVGALNILKNEITYRMPIRYVEVRLRGKLTHNHIEAGYNFHTEVNFNNRTFNMTSNIPGAPTNNQTFNMNSIINNWKNIILNAESELKNVFFQSLIHYDPIKRINGEIDYRTIELNFGDYTLGSNIPGNLPIDIIKKQLANLFPTTGGYGSIGVNEESLVKFITALKDIYTATYNGSTDLESIIAFIFPVSVVVPTDFGSNGVTQGAANGFLDKCFLFMNNNGWSNMVIIHEIAHSLGLVHSFQVGLSSDNNIAVYPDHSFRYLLTENIMDYNLPGDSSLAPGESSVSNKISFWKWQWEKMLQDKDLIKE